MRFRARAVNRRDVSARPGRIAAPASQDLQVGSSRYRVISTNKSGFHSDLDSAAVEGLRIVAADTALWVAITGTAAKTGRRQSLHVETWRRRGRPGCRNDRRRHGRSDLIDIHRQVSD